MLPPRKTRTIHVRDLAIGGSAPIAVQSMAATQTRNVEATARQVRLLEEAGADLIRIAVDSKQDVEALAEIRRGTRALLSVDLQENYRLAELFSFSSTRSATTPATCTTTRRRRATGTRSRTSWGSRVSTGSRCASA